MYFTVHTLGQLKFGDTRVLKNVLVCACTVVGLGRDTPHYEPLVPSFGKGVDLRNDP